ncbi:FAD-binding domain-containing protein [Falsiroseomonas stagni]|uniref:Deoxyribodipyrimidine photo-lyase n=1 Tax=Falsiroseomonas stagni DSM 19981 TaxID=1123062 RepID=A0A1I3Z8K1_9PROT|nr:FAD-binding domain-containing protein [Falsiroseomonas stagni]SFK40387.1 deoxyribodipyrimidine photo-lyase [Falsiroseomonas stagni DSM 19981]
MSDPFPTDRTAALQRLADFAPRMGRDYAQGRNTDPGPGRRRDVSCLSPAIRHRLVTEAEVVGAAVAGPGPRAAEKFIQEVFWRSYWKGFLELRPGMWAGYRTAVAADRAAIRGHALARAEAGTTGIGCFDAWVDELRSTGWLHNHARMWFASIWIFTLKLPWTLGADFMLRHLRDGDAASNTLSWRWVAGIQTPGKHYVARAENIARYTEGRFDPTGELEEDPRPIDAPPPPRAGALPAADRLPDGAFALLLHEDDLHPESLLPAGARVAAIAGVAVPEARSDGGCSALVADSVGASLADGLARASAHWGVPAVRVGVPELAGWAASHGLPVVTPWAPVGWTADALAGAGVPMRRVRRDWDSACWPLATKGFFPFREGIPTLLGRLVPDQPAGQPLWASAR